MDLSRKRLVEILKYKISSPTTVWFGSLYFFGLLSMIVNNIFRKGGISMESLAGGPRYYANLFLYYGINIESDYNTPWDSGILAWIIAPYLAIFMGLVLYYLPESGYAYNGNTRYMDPFLEPGDPFYAFFNENVYGAGELLFGMKGNLFYITIVWFPIIAASIVTLFYSRWTKRESWIVTRVVITFGIAFWLGIEVARITDPNLSFSISGFFDSLFVNRDQNNFAVYDGQYHPMMLTTVFGMFQAIPAVIMGLMGASVSVYHMIRHQYRIYQIRQEYIANARAQGIDKLPWEEETPQGNNAGE